MNIEQYAEKIKLYNKSEIDKVKYLMFYVKIVRDLNELSIKEIVDLLLITENSRPNTTRLKKKLINSRQFKKGISNDKYSLSSKTIAELKLELDFWSEIDETIISDNELLDESLFLGKRGYIDKLVIQINACYGNNIYDGCAVLMRRLFEIMLIHAYENLSIVNEIKNPDNSYKMLKQIVANAKNNTTLGLSRIRDDLDIIRDIGNLAAHRITYNTRKKDIDDIKVKYRTCLEELMYKSGFVR